MEKKYLYIVAHRNSKVFYEYMLKGLVKPDDFGAPIGSRTRLEAIIKYFKDYKCYKHTYLLKMKVLPNNFVRLVEVINMCSTLDKSEPKSLISALKRTVNIKK